MQYDIDGLLSDNRPILFPLHFPIAIRSTPSSQRTSLSLRTNFSISFRLIFKTFQQIYRPQNPTFQIFRWQPPSFLSSTHREAPASNLRLLGPFIFILAPHPSKFSHCGHSTQTGTPHPSATRGFRGLYQFFIMCATSRRFRSMRTFLASRSPFPAKSR